MKAVICDICKKIIPSIKSYSEGQIIEMTITRYNVEKINYDLCSDCSKKVLNFLRNGKA